ncbi:hypothetical protein DOTSEDRAFT_31998 [Dothistroma septosporum NZE10]|uniref:Uncharacterized protein n=1 Tax=Dothistroma septosporum (strain NZE10 / CBS 128990) TaxID=675120 RepID=N1PVT4_DOTSN|nr:hypothetical protein DOTSEDRAFT_31998 [Dothistroma septosporum NZE10]
MRRSIVEDTKKLGSAFDVNGTRSYDERLRFMRQAQGWKAVFRCCRLLLLPSFSCLRLSTVGTPTHAFLGEQIDQRQPAELRLQRRNFDLMLQQNDAVDYM